MQCRDAQFYLRLRRHTGDELGVEVVAELERHLAGCPECAADARAAAAFDRALATAMRSVPVPVGLREKLFTQAAAYRGGVIRRTVYRSAALAASVFLVLGLAFGVFTATRPKLDIPALLASADQQRENPDEALRQWLIDQGFPAQLPVPFNTDLFIGKGSERIQGRDVPFVLFQHPTELGFAKVYFFTPGSSIDARGVQDAQASMTVARVVVSQGVTYVIVHTVHPVGPNEDLLRPFLRSNRSFAKL
jgi:hypothetical protein